MLYQYSHRLGAYAPGLDPDAKAYIAAVETALSSSISGDQKNAINDFFKTGKSDGWYSSLKRLYLPIWADAAANAIDMVTRISGTFPVGGVDQSNVGYVQGDGSTGYFDVGKTASELGLAFDNAWFGMLVKQDGVNDPAVYLGARTASTSVINFSKSGNDLRTTVANDGLLTWASATINGIISSRRGSATRSMYRRHSSARSEVASDSTAATGSLPSANLNYMRFNRTDGSPVYSSAQFGAVWFGTEETDTQDSAFTLALKNLWETASGLTLP